MPELVTHADDREVYRAGKFVYDAEDRSVTVTKDTRTGILNVAYYEYANHEQACDAAWRMAVKQSRA